MSKAFFAMIALVLGGARAALGATDDLPGVATDNPVVVVSPWHWFGDAMLRGNRTEDIPRPVEPSFSDAFARGRFGVAYDPIPELEFGAAIKLAASTSSNSQDRLRNVNERSNDVAMDQFYVRWLVAENGSLLLGKAPFPLQLSQMLWDPDLRPVGASANVAFGFNEFDRFELMAGYFAGALPYGDNSRIGAMQAAYHWHEGAPVNGSIALSYLDFSDLEQLVLQGLSRTNQRVAGTTNLVSDFHLLDLQFVGRTHVADMPLEVRLDVVRNLGADDQRDGARGSIMLGDSRQRRGWELGLADQRIQRDAVMAAFNSDDWWFHSWARGMMAWVAYGFSPTWSTRLAAFHERRDGISAHTDRVLLDLYAHW
jgi:hypothetical protein